MVWIAAVACAQEPLHKPGKAQTSEGGFRLGAITDLVYLPKPEEPSGDETQKTHKKQGDKSRSGTSTTFQKENTVPEGLVGKSGKTPLFWVSRDGKGPADGFFRVGEKAVAPVWKSSDPSVLKITMNAQSVPSCTIYGPGKTTVTVSVGDWSDHTDLEVVNSTFSMGTSRHDLLKQYGYPAKKYKLDQPKMPAGFEKVPPRCCMVDRDYIYIVDFQPFTGRGYRAAGVYDAQGGEFWEYPQWSRCLIFIKGQVEGIATRPAQKGDAARVDETSTAKQPTEPRENR
jgi:hypothetical protein